MRASLLRFRRILFIYLLFSIDVFQPYLEYTNEITVGINNKKQKYIEISYE